MQFDYSSGKPQDIAADTLVMFTPQLTTISDRKLKELDQAVDGALSFLLKSEDFTGKQNQIAAFYKPAGYKADRVMLAGL